MLRAERVCPHPEVREARGDWAGVTTDVRPEALQPRHFLQPCLLLLIKESSAHGYDLLERLGDFGFERDPGSMYRALRQMEREGLVESEWTLSTEGRGRRRYRLTEAGDGQLRAWAQALDQTRAIIDGYLARFRAATGATVELG